MAQAGFNTVRVYTVPEIGLLDAGGTPRPARHGGRAMDAARRVPGRSCADAKHPGADGLDRARPGVAPGGVDVRRRQRDSAVGSPLARPGPHRALPPRSLRRRKTSLARQPPDLRQLPADRVPGPRLLRRVQLQRLPARRSRPARLSRAAPARRRREAVPARGGRGRQPARGARRPGGDHGHARAGRVRGRRLRRGGVRLDRRMVARRAHGGRLAVRPGGQGAPAEAGAGGRVAGVRRGAVHVRRPRPLAESLGGGLRLQRRRHDRRVPGVADGADLPERRPDCRQRRVEGLDRADRAAVSQGPRHRHPQWRPQRGAQRRPGPCHGRHRRLHGCGRAGRSRLAHLPGAAHPLGRLRRLGRAERRAARRRLGGAVRGAGAGRADARAARRSRRRARARLQHGVSPRRPPVDRRLQPGVSPRRRRR